MTIKELYEWALQEHVEDYDLCVQYYDCYYGYDKLGLGDCSENKIDVERKEVIL